MSSPDSREKFTQFCIRQLGGRGPNDINLTKEQVDDCVDLALQYFRDFHYDGTEPWYVSHQITQEDKDNKYITVDDDIIGISRVLPIGTTQATINMFDLRYQLRLNDLYDFTNTSYTNYVLTMQQLRTLDMLFTGETLFRYNRHTKRVYVDFDWVNGIQVGEYMVLDGFQIVDPDAYTDTWNDRMFKQLATAYMKRLWGTNLKKFSGVKLLGGITLNGQIIYDEAVEEVDKIEEKIQMMYQAPPRPYLGGETG